MDGRMKQIAVIIVAIACGCSTVERKSVTRYEYEPPMGKLIVEIGSAAHCQNVWRWPPERMGLCIPELGIIQLRAGSYDKNGNPMPPPYYAGHEFMHAIDPNRKEEEMPR